MDNIAKIELQVSSDSKFLKDIDFLLNVIVTTYNLETQKNISVLISKYNDRYMDYINDTLKESILSVSRKISDKYKKDKIDYYFTEEGYISFVQLKLISLISEEFK